MTGFYFIAIFLVILALFIFFIRWVSHRLSHRISAETFSRIENIIIGGIILGVVCMFQPWLFIAYKVGFLILLFSTLGFIVWSHITPSVEQLDPEQH